MKKRTRANVDAQVLVNNGADEILLAGLLQNNQKDQVEKPGLCFICEAGMIISCQYFALH